MSRKRALITGIFGQDGSYLCELLSKKGYEVYGIEKTPLSNNAVKIKDHLKSKKVSPKLLNCDLYSYDDVFKTINKIKPNEVYHLAAKHFSSQSKGSNDNTDIKLYQDNVSATLNILNALYKVSPISKCVLVGSCLMFDASSEKKQSEKTQFKTISMYGLAKIAEYYLGKYYRNKGMHVSMAIFYNHESPRRSEDFVTKKIVMSMVKIKKGEIRTFELGNLDAVKDWGYAKEYVYGLWQMSQMKRPDDYILATGIKHTVKDFVVEAANVLGIDNWRKYVSINSKIINRNISSKLIGIPHKAINKLKWKPKVGFKDLVKIMIKKELNGSLD